MPTQRFVKGWEAHADVRETHLVVLVVLRVPPGGPRGGGRPTHPSRRGQEAHPEVWEESGGPPGSSGGREAHLVFRAGSEGPPGGL